MCFDKTAATLIRSDQLQCTQKRCGLCCIISYVKIEKTFCVGRIIKVVGFGFGRFLKALLSQSEAFFGRKKSEVFVLLGRYAALIG